MASVYSKRHRHARMHTTDSVANVALADRENLNEGDFLSFFLHSYNWMTHIITAANSHTDWVYLGKKAAACLEQKCTAARVGNIQTSLCIGVSRACKQRLKK